MRLPLKCLACAMVMAAATPVNAQKPIPLRSLTPAVGTDSGVIQFVDNIRPLANGKVLVNDTWRQRLVLFEQSLQRFTTIMDTASGARTAYPGNTGGVILRYPGDSTAFLDGPSKALVIISPSGAIVRTIALRDARDAIYLSLGYRGAQGFDDHERLVFVAYNSSRPGAAPKPPEPKPGQNFTVKWAHDSALILRRDPAAGRTDTIGLAAHAMTKWIAPYPRDPGSFETGARIPIPTVDEWALLPDGTVAIVRGHDYHIDWIAPNGKVTSTPKMPFDWLRITPEQKQHFADSVNEDIAKRRGVAPPAASLPPGLSRPDPRALPAMSFEADSLPDYYPPIREFTVKSDPDGNLWVLPTTSVLADGGLVYDVINRKGDIIERVKLPPGRRLLAVGYRGVVYMAYTPKGLVRLERATIIR